MLGTVNPVADIVARAHAAGAVAVVDGAQAVPQMPVDVGALDADFYAWTGHKAYGPTGLGVLHGRRALLDAMPPFLGGGHMISNVTVDEIRWARSRASSRPARRTSPRRSAWAPRSTSCPRSGWTRCAPTSASSPRYALERLAEVPGVAINGPGDADARGALVSFTLDAPPARRGRDPRQPRRLRPCRPPLRAAAHECLGVGATTRASFAVHNSRTDIDALIDGLDEVRRVFA